MNATKDRNAEKFDAYAHEYERLHAESVAVSGESTGYFADYKVDCLQRAGVSDDDAILDFGCGIGNVTSRLIGRFRDVHAYEPSRISAQVAQRRSPGAFVESELSRIMDAGFSVALLSGVLHHLPPGERPEVLAQVVRKLRPGGRLFVFEHNPLNPLTRRAVADCPFDDDAIMLWPREARRLLRTAGFDRIRLDHIVFFPRQLSFLRPLEPWLGWLPLGGQVMLVGTKPAP